MASIVPESATCGKPMKLSKCQPILNHPLRGMHKCQVKTAAMWEISCKGNPQMLLAIMAIWTINTPKLRKVRTLASPLRGNACDCP
jgi:hypothetical protein